MWSLESTSLHSYSLLPFLFYLRRYFNIILLFYYSKERKSKQADKVIRYTVMNIWDWHYRIFFDDTIKEQLLNESNKLAIGEQQIVNIQIKFYTSFYSFGILFDNISDAINYLPREVALKRVDNFIDKAYDCKEQLIILPRELYDYYRIRISNLPLSFDSRHKLGNILQASLSARNYQVALHRYLEALFGNSFKDLCNIFTSFDYKFILKEPQSNSKIENYEETIQQYINDCAKNQEIINQFGEKTSISYNTLVDNETICYGEWWDSDVIKVPFSNQPTGKNQLVIHAQHGLITEDELYFTLIHEVYPGHGYFYNKTCDGVRNTADTTSVDGNMSSSYIDHGAMTLFEGWATYCEWNTLRSPYIEVVRNNALNFMRNLFLTPPSRLPAKILAKRYYTTNQYKKIILATQYLGYYESYYLGALWFENYFNKSKSKPIDFLNRLKGLPKGDFFRLYEKI